MLIWLGTSFPLWNRFVFLDRDGVLNADRKDFVKTPDDYRFYPESLEALRQLKERRVHPILISNQSGLGRGIITLENFWSTHQFMVRTIEENGGELFAAFYCPHTPEDECSCRKPSPGLIHAATDLFNMNLSRTVFLGDRLTDMKTARQAGCQGILIRRLPEKNKEENAHPPAPPPQPDERSFSSLTDAVETLFPMKQQGAVHVEQSLFQ